MQSSVAHLKSAGETLEFDLPEVIFERDCALLTAQARRQLDEFAEALEHLAVGGSGFIIAGHSDASGSAVYNQRLSEQRPDAARAYPIERHTYNSDRIAASAWREPAAIGLARRRPGSEAA
jgi:outer membrane protein OmpA-like peptidoglycan-associated protein